jgi:YD repeat-containing protein
MDSPASATARQAHLHIFDGAGVAGRARRAAAADAAAFLRAAASRTAGTTTQPTSDTRSLYDTQTFHYDHRGNRDSITDNAGNTWTYSYDLLGRKTTAHDPDAGDTTPKRLR